MKKPIAFLGMLAAATAFADPQVPAYDSQPLQLNGMIQQAFYEQPQAYLTVKTTDQTWTVLLAPPARMQERELRRATLAPGTRVSVQGYRSVSDPLTLQAERISVHGHTVALSEEVERPGPQSQEPLEDSAALMEEEEMADSSQ